MYENLEGRGSSSSPADLNITVQPDLNKNYFTITVPGLKINTDYAFNFQWIYPDGTVSDWSPGYKVHTAGYTTKLTTPTVTVTPASLGYIVSYTKQTDSNFAYAIVEEVVSDALTAPSTGWVEVAVASSNPIVVTVGNINRRWVRVKLSDKIAGGTAYSTPVAVTPVDPVAAALDITPPSSATGITASWVGNDISISTTVAADAKKFIIKLTNGSNDGYFTKFPSTSGTSQTILITKSELYNTFGQYFTSFTGLFVSADSLDNRDAGTAFSVSEKTNPLLSIVPTFTLTAITNGYTATWTLPTGASYAKVYESGTSWGAGNPTESDLVFSGQSPAIVKKTVYTQRFVKIKFLTDDGFESSWSAEQSVTPIDAIAADVVPPSAPSTVATPTSGIDTTGTLGFNGFINLSWTAVSDSTLRGYRIRFRPSTTPASNYSYVDSPGTGTTYRLGGLAVGATYEIGIASYDEFNNTTSTYTSFTNTVISGTPSLSNYITSGAAGFQFGSGIKNSTGTQDATAQGIYLSNNNYWYLTGANSALFKIGGATTNYVSWDGTSLKVDGNIGVAGGTTIGGNIAMGTSGASIYQGTLNGSGNLTSDGFILNSSGLSIKKGTVNLRLDTSDGGIYAQYGQIAGWTLDSTKFEKLVSSSYTGVSTNGSYSFYAGSATSGGDSNAQFYVTPAGAVQAKNINISGGSLTIGSSSIAASTGKLIATDAEITGKITASTGKIGNININSGGLYITDNSATAGNRIIFDSGGIAAYANGITAPKFILANDGTAKIGGWTINATSISSGAGGTGIILDASGQTISFKQGFIIDNDTISVPLLDAAINTGSSTSEADTPDSYYSSYGAIASSVPGSTIAIKLPTTNFTNSPKFVMTTSSTSGASILLENYGNSYASSIQLSNGGIDIYVGRPGAVTLRGFTSKKHNNYNNSEVASMLMIKSDGTLSTGRSIFKSGSSETNIVTNGTHNSVGLVGDIIFSTSD